MTIRRYTFVVIILFLMSAIVIVGCSNTNNNGNKTTEQSSSISASDSVGNNSSEQIEPTDSSVDNKKTSSENTDEQHESSDETSFDNTQNQPENSERSWVGHTPSKDIVDKLKYIGVAENSNGEINITLQEAVREADIVCGYMDITQEQFDNVILYMDESYLKHQPASPRKIAEAAGKDYNGERLTVETVKKFIRETYEDAKEKNIDLDENSGILLVEILMKIKNYMQPDYVDTTSSLPSDLYIYYVDDSGKKIIEVSNWDIHYYEYDNNGDETLFQRLYSEYDYEEYRKFTGEELYEKYLNY